MGIGLAIPHGQALEARGRARRRGFVVWVGAARRAFLGSGERSLLDDVKLLAAERSGEVVCRSTQLNDAGHVVGRLVC